MGLFLNKTTSAGLAAALLISAVALLIGLGGAPPAALAQTTSGGCSKGLVTAKGCESHAAVSRHLGRILRDARSDYGLKAALLRVDAGPRTLIRTALGKSQRDANAKPRMHFRVGSMAIPWLTTIVLQLRDEGRLSLDDKISRWLPDFPRADQVTVRMLANSTSGYFDYARGNQPFVDTFYANPFRRWTQRELLDTALSRGFACDPGTCFNYSHINFILLSRIVKKLTEEKTKRQMTRRILKPLELDQTQISSRARIPGPVLHAFTAERGVYEDSTAWSPSWTLGTGTIATSTIDDIAASARAILSGKLLSRSSRRLLVARDAATAGPGSIYFGLGVVVSNGWRLQNPSLNGYSGFMAYLPQGKLSVALTTTNNRPAALTGENFTEKAFARLAEYLAPEHVPDLG
jgi:CubicO group peptidase (beta-lactamase class C family)